MPASATLTPEHGTVERYDHRDPAVRCRCEHCRAAHATRARQRRHGTWERRHAEHDQAPTLFDAAPSLLSP